jgi:predicted nucleic acid-binding protein
VAVNGGAAAIITGGRDLLGLDPFHGSRILDPANFLTWP